MLTHIVKVRYSYLMGRSTYHPASSQHHHEPDITTLAPLVALITRISVNRDGFTNYLR